MTPAEALAICEATVRGVDADRYFSALFAPPDRRPLLYALYAFNHEIARATDAGSESSLGEIRLQWWREAVDDARTRRPRAHPVAIALSEAVSRTSVDFTCLDALIDAKEAEQSIVPFATLASMEAHAEATSSALMRLAAKLLDSTVDAVELTREAGIAYGLTGMLRAVPFHAARGKLYLPENLVAAESVTCAAALAGKSAAALQRVVEKVAACAIHHLGCAKTMDVPPTIVPAILPAALVPAYRRRLNDPDPLRARPDVSQLRRQITLLRAAWRARL
jgi:phytoene synthase